MKQLYRSEDSRKTDLKHLHCVGIRAVKSWKRRFWRLAKPTRVTQRSLTTFVLWVTLESLSIKLIYLESILSNLSVRSSATYHIKTAETAPSHLTVYRRMTPHICTRLVRLILLHHFEWLRWVEQLSQLHQCKTKAPVREKLVRERDTVFWTERIHQSFTYLNGTNNTQ